MQLTNSPVFWFAVIVLALLALRLMLTPRARPLTIEERRLEALGELPPNWEPVPRHRP